jgi:glucan 1,3-beta-glucosidase
MTVPTLNPKRKIRGVNLGGWLLLEKWMTPTLFDGLSARDETGFCVELGDKAESRLRKHWDSFITESDFIWIAERGLNCVRIPVGHWIFGPPYPYHPKYEGNPHPFVTGSLEYLDRAFEWAEKHKLSILIDFHAAPGCQNGFDNGGIMEVMDWPSKPEYIEFSLDILERLAARYATQKTLHGIEILNEPRWDIPTELLKDFNLKAHARIRKHCKAENTVVVFHDGFRSWTEYEGFMSGPNFENVVYDIHRYQCFDRADIDMDIYGHIQKSAVLLKQEADAINHGLGHPTYVGEWSLGLDLKVVSLWAPGPYNHALEHMDRLQEDVAYRAYGSAQLMTYEQYLGWFFWSYKTETTPAWCFRDCVNNGWLPQQFE